MRTFQSVKTYIRYNLKMKKEIIMLCVAFGLIVCINICQAERTGKSSLKSRVSILELKTDSLRGKVDELQKIVLHSGEDYDENGNETSTDLDSVKLDEAIASAYKLKTEVNSFVTTSRIGLEREKKWQRDTVKNLTEYVENIQTVMTEDNLAVQQHLDTLDTELATIDQSFKESHIKLQEIDNELNMRKRKNRNDLQAQGDINDRLSTAIDELRAKQQNTEAKTQALSQALIDEQQNNNKMRPEIQALRHTVTELQTDLTKLKSESLSTMTSITPFLHAHTCDEGWHRFNGHCYLPVEIGKTWDEASASCREKNSYLFEITTDEEFGFVEPLLGYHLKDWRHRFWIGASDRSREGTFVYEHSNLQVPQKYWGDGEPNNKGGDENCVVVSRVEGNFGFNDFPCNKGTYFVCEKDRIIGFTGTG